MYRICRLAVAIGLASSLLSCGSGGGLRVFFTTNGLGACTGVTVEVDLAGADASVDLLRSRVLDCALEQSLRESGCTATFEELDDGDLLRVVVSGCTVSPVAALFHCGFDSGEIGRIQDQAFASCACAGPGCDATPPLCVSDQPDPASCEQCSNGLDDDGNGLVDCDDENCVHDPSCQVAASTTTTSTTVETAPTTTLPSPSSCSLTVRLVDPVTVAALGWRLDYGQAGVEFVGSGSAVACSNLVAGTIVAFNDADAAAELSGGLISLSGVTGPLDLATCVYTRAPGPPPELPVTTLDASDVFSQPIEPLPSLVAVESPGCSGAPTSTTTTLDDGPSTTTSTTTTSTESTTTTSLMPDSERYSVTIHLVDAPTKVGSLQLRLDYSAAMGEFAGAVASGACTSHVAGALFAMNDIDAERIIRMGFVIPAGVDAPRHIATCLFTAANPEDAPVAEDFGLFVEEASSVTLQPIEVSVALEVVAPGP